MPATPQRLVLHPDALFDGPYQEQAFDPDPYLPPPGPWHIEARLDRGLLLRAADGAALQVEACTEHVLRLRAAPAPGAIGPSVTERLGLVNTAFAPCAWQELPDGIATAHLSLRVDPDTGALACRDAGGRILFSSHDAGIRFSGAAPDYGRGHRFLAEFALGQERIFGFGGRVRPPDRTGTTCDLFAVKVGKCTGDYGGFPIPFFLSTAGYGFFLNNPWPHVYFDMGASDPRRWWVHAPGGDCDCFLIAGPAFPDIVRRFTSLVGRIPEPRRWWLGYWCSSLGFRSSEEVLAYARCFRSEGYPLEAMVLDGPWRGGPEFLEKYMRDGEYPTNDVDWHPDFGDGPALVRQLADIGVRTVLHQNSRNFKQETITAGLADGVLRRQGLEVVVRVTDPAAEAWYIDRLRPRHREGVAMWWLDHGDRMSGEIAAGIPSRNLFGALWARLVDEAGRAEGRPPGLSLCRGAGIGGQRYALPWPGDTRYGIDFQEHDIWFCLNAGLCGFPITSADLGGFFAHGLDQGAYNTAFDVDNLARRLCQAILFLPTPRVHADSSAPPKVPWNCPAEVQRLYRAVLLERYRLTPYFLAYAWQAHYHGDPILRPLVYAWQDRPEVWPIGDEFLIGDWLLMAPVCHRQATSRPVYLPPGLWIDYWTDTIHRGPTTIEVPTPPLRDLRPAAVRARRRHASQTGGRRTTRRRASGPAHAGTVPVFHRRPTVRMFARRTPGRRRWNGGARGGAAPS